MDTMHKPEKEKLSVNEEVADKTPRSISDELSEEQGSAIPEDTKVPETTETKETMEATEATEAMEAMEISEVLKVPEASAVQDAREAPQVPETMDELKVPEALEAPAVSEDPKESESQETQEITKVSETLATLEVLKPLEVSQSPEPIVTPEAPMSSDADIDIAVVAEESAEEPDLGAAPADDKEAEAEEFIEYDLEVAVEEEDDDDEDDDEEGEESDTDEDTAVTLPPVEEIVQRLRDLHASEKLKRKDVEECKSQFYRSLRNEIEKQKQSFLSEGGEEIDFVANEPEEYVEGKELLQKIKEKRAELAAKEEAEKEKNVVRKLAIIEQVKALTESQGQEDFNKTYQEFRNLQQEWNEIKLIPQARVNELWKSYQRYVEKFYDLVRINNEFREYDFKKNLEMKTALCEAAERLDGEPDVVSAFHQLQNLHQEWREIGPVSRKDREDIWNRFKEASTFINKKYQAHFETLKEQEEKNLELKTTLCEKLEAIDYTQLKTIRDWNKKVKEVLEVQSQWRQIGYVPRKHNTKIYRRYRAACDFFFRLKNEFYRSLRSEMEENLKKKISLCERAEELKDSTDWKNTTKVMIDIQKEWKTIGIVPRKHVDSIWRRFITACDYFFEQKKLQTSSRYAEEGRNMEAKKAIVHSISQLDHSLSPEDALVKLRELMDQWHAIGHVPYKMKDRAYQEFHDAAEAQFDRLNIDKEDRMLEAFKTNISDMAKGGNAQHQLYREREKLMRQYERLKSELQTYENNIGFLSVSSKKGNHLLDDMNKKMEKLKADLQLIIRKVEALDKEL